MSHKKEFSEDMEREIQQEIDAFWGNYEYIKTFVPDLTRGKFLESVEDTYKSSMIKVRNLQRSNPGGHLDDEVLRIQCIAMQRMLGITR